MSTPATPKTEDPPMHSLTPTPTQWAIDPALQAQSSTRPGTPAATTTATTAVTTATTYTPPASYTPPATYTSTATASGPTYQPYQYYPGYYSYTAQTPTATPTSTATTTATTTTTTQPATQTSAVAAPAPAQTSDSNDIATLNDALGSAGVDLRAEEESLTRSSVPSASYYTQSRKPTQVLFTSPFLSSTVRTIASSHALTRGVPEDVITYLSLALRARLGDLLSKMIAAREHRTDAQFDRQATFYPQPVDTTGSGVLLGSDGVAHTAMPPPTPMWGIRIRSDVSKQLAAIARVEKDEESKIRREREILASALASQTAPMDADLDGEEEEQPKKKRKKEGPGVTARNMSEDVRKKMSNAVASQAAGTKNYAWMNAAASSSSAGPVKKPVQKVYTTTSSTSVNKDRGSIEEEEEEKAGKNMSVTMRDAMFVISTERGHGGGKGSAKGWT